MKKEIRLIKGLTSKVLIFLGLIMALNQNTIFGQPLHASDSGPTYKGGIKALKEFIDKNLIFPDVAQKAGISGTVNVSYMINKEGKVENVKIIRGISPECDNEAIRITQLIEGWEPGMQQGKPINMFVNMPIEFRTGKEIKPIVFGKITDIITGLPIEGALVKVKGTSIGTITNSEGSYRLPVPGENDCLEFSTVGYATKVEQIGQYRSINVELSTEPYTVNFNSWEN
jgi:TonB family protein